MAARARTLILLLAACCLPAASRTHVYDALNRIESVTESGAASWSRSFTYDRYGNRAATGFQVTVATPPAATSTYYTAATNRMATDWASYDDAGNMTAFKNPNGTSDGQWSAAYDGENKQRYYCDGTIAACGAANKTGEYVYDGEGNRVLKMVTGGATTTYVYDAFGRLAAEYTVGGPSETAGTFYRTTDHLGSTRLVTDSSGDVISRRDFFPFGEEIPAASSSGRIISGSGYNQDMGFPQLFTAKERDAESGLDYFDVRYLSGTQGRFTSTDPLDGWPGDSQSWNKYAYARNNPLLYTDPSGMRYTICDTSGNCEEDYSDADFDKNLSGTSKDGTIFDNDGNKIGTYQRTSFDDLSAVGNLFFGDMSNRREASNQMIATVAGGSAAAGVTGGAAVATGTTVAVIDGVAYSAEQLAALGPAALARLVAAGKISINVLQKLAAQGSAVASQAYSRLFAQSNNTTIPQGLLNGNNYLRVGEGFAPGGPVFRIAIGSKHVPLPSWVPGLVKGTLHINLWRR